MDITLHTCCNDCEKTFLDGVISSYAELFQFVEGDKEICKTVQSMHTEYDCFFEKISPQYDAVVHICIGLGSLLFQNAVIARKIQNCIHNRFAESIFGIGIWFLRLPKWLEKENRWRNTRRLKEIHTEGYASLLWTIGLAI